MKKITFYGNLLFTIFLVCSKTNAQNHLKIKDAIDLAITNNESLNQSKIDTKIAIQEKAKTNSIFLPQVDLSYTALFTNNPLNAFGFKLNQEIVTQNDFTPTLLNDPDNSQNFTTALQFKQPLLNLDAIYKRESAKSISNSKIFTEKRQEEYLRFKVKKAYMQIYLAYQNKKMMKQIVTTAKSLEQKAKDMKEQGLINIADYLEAKTYLLSTQTQFENAKSGIENSCDQLSLLMGQKIGQIYTVEKIKNSSDSQIYLIRKQDNSFYNRNDIKAYRAGIKSSKDNLLANKLSFAPKINAFGSYQFNDKDFAQIDAKSYLLGISMNWKIFGGTSKIHNIKSAKLSLERIKSQLKETQSQAQVDFNQAIRTNNNLNKELKLLNEMYKQTKETLRIQNDRYNQGLISTSDLLRIHSQMAQQKLSLEMIEFKIYVNSAWLQLIIGKTIEKN